MQHPVVSREEWLAARKVLLEQEKEETRLRDKVRAARQALPWVKLDKNYIFDTPEGRKPLSDLFDGRHQLIVYHFMLGPGWKAGCPGCSFLSDHIDGALPHLNHHDVTWVAVSLAPMNEVASYKKRMGWKFPWVSSFASDFNYDYHVSFTAEERAQGKVTYNYEEMAFPSEEGPGLSVFYKDADGQIFHTYSSYSRGLDIFVGAYNFLDHAPKGRDEEGLAHTMAWVRHHDKYDQGYAVDPKASYVEIAKAVGSYGPADHHD
jgi:predicted dithiol-disulfide oxidoreductase (DUF899 family)